MIYGYCRVSTQAQADGNSLEEQEAKILKEYSEAKIFKEIYTGKTADRPVFKDLLKTLEKGDKLIVCKLDRFCRSVREGLEVIEKLLENEITIHILNMGLIDNSPIGKLTVTNLLAFAEFERAMIVERTQAGKAIAKKKEGFREGRPRGYTKKQLDHALDLKKEYSYNQVAEMTGISRSTLIREVNRRKIEECK